VKCNYWPKTYAVKRYKYVSRKKNQDKGDIIEKECPDQADRCAVLTLIARQPASNSHGQNGNTRNASQDNPDWLRKRLPNQKGNRHRRNRNQCKSG
jgi:hypothetical protein